MYHPSPLIFKKVNPNANVILSIEEKKVVEQGPNVGRAIIFGALANHQGCGGEGIGGTVVADTLHSMTSSKSRMAYVKADNCICTGEFQGGCNGYPYDPRNRDISGSVFFTWAEESYEGQKVKLKAAIGTGPCGGEGDIATIITFRETGGDNFDAWVAVDGCLCSKPFCDNKACDGLPGSLRDMKSTWFEWIEPPQPRKVPVTTQAQARGMPGFVEEEGKYWTVVIPDLALHLQSDSLENAYKKVANAIEGLVDRNNFRVDVVPKGEGRFEIIPNIERYLDRLQKRRQQMMNKARIKPL